MSKWEKLKRALEWVHLLRVVLELIVMVASWKVAATVLLRVLSPGWASLAALLVAGSLLLAIERWRQKVGKSPKQAIQQGVAKALIAPPTVPDSLDATPFLKIAYTSSMQSEIENRTRMSAAQTQPNDQEGFYVRLIAVGIIQFSYDMIWTNIYKSQLLMLLELDRKGFIPVSEAKTYYDNAASEAPFIYENYSFEQWLDFLKEKLLLIRHPSEMLEVTIQAKDFLKYLVHWGRYADARRF